MLRFTKPTDSDASNVYNAAMSNDATERWQQRAESFSKAFVRLQDACELNSYSELERAGLVQTFEFSFELGWKTLKDLLFADGVDANSPRDVIRKSLSAGYLTSEDCETLLDALMKRNLLAHTYKESTAAEAERLIKKLYAPCLNRISNFLTQRQDNA